MPKKTTLRGQFLRTSLEMLGLSLLIGLGLMAAVMTCFVLRVPDGGQFLADSFSFVFGKETMGPSGMVPFLILAGVLLCLAPSFVVLMSAALWRAPITKRKLAALALALLGCAFVSGIAGGGLTVSLGGILLGVAAGFCYATYTIFAHYGLQHYDSYTMTYWTFMFAGIGSLFFLKPAELPLVFASSRGVLGMLGLVVVSTVLPYIFYTKGLEGVESGKASIIANVEPVVGALLGVLVFHETLDAWTVLGIVCVLGGVILLAGGEKAVEQAAAAQ